MTTKCLVCIPFVFSNQEKDVSQAVSTVCCLCLRADQIGNDVSEKTSE